MKRILVCAALLGVLGQAQAAQAQEKKVSFGVDGMAALPLGDLGDVAGFGIGVLGRVEYALDENMSVTGRIGFIYHLPKDDLSYNEIPLHGGIKYKLGSFYGLGELGFTRMSVSAEVDGFSYSADETNLSLFAGAAMPMGKLRIIAGILAPDLGNIDDGFDLMAGVSYMF